MTDADPRMTEADRELMALVQTRAPEELTPGEVARLQAALAHSPALQQALSERLEMEQYLSAALGTSQVSAERVIAAAAKAAEAPGQRLISLLGLAVCLALAAVIGSVLLVAGRSRSEPQGDDATHVKVAESSHAPPPDSAHAAPAGALAAHVPAESPEPSPSTAGQGPAGPPAAAPAPAGPAPSESAGAPAPHTAAQVPAAPQEPWEAPAVLAAQPAPTGAEALDDFNARTSAPNESQLRRWFEKVPGQNGNLANYKSSNTICGLVEGVLRLRSPWAPGVALRLSLQERPKLQIHLWNGDRGLTVRSYENQRVWVAYETSRKGGSPLPEIRRLAAHDEGLAARVNPVEPATFDLSFDGQQFALSRGNIPLLRAPFAGLPQQVYFEGKAVLRQLELVRAVDLPAAAPPGPIVADLRQPASGAWLTDHLENGVFAKLPDGSVELKPGTPPRPLWVSLPLPFDRVQEVVFQLDDVGPGAGILWGDPRGKPLGGLGFYQEKRTRKLVLQPGNPSGGGFETQADPDHEPVAFCGPQVWIKMLSGGGPLRWWLSDDGVHWAKAHEPWPNMPELLGSVGLYCAPDKQAHGIKLRRIIVRELPAMSTLVSRELRPRLPALSGRADLGSWLATVYGNQPRDVDGASWRTTCAFRSLAGDVVGTPRQVLLFKGLDDVLASDRPWRQRLQLLHEAAQIAACWDDPGPIQRLVARYSQFASLLAREGNAAALAEVARAQLAAPLWIRHPVPASDELFREPILHLAFAQRWPELYDFCDQLRFSRRNAPRQPVLMDWAEAYAARQVPQHAAAGAALLRSDWRHPLVAELSKEGFNLLAELEAALESKSYQEACQIVSTAGSPAGPGLLPDSHDPDLLTSLAAAVDRAMQEHPALRATMNDQFGPVGRLRIRQAITEDDVAAVEAGALQFTGTEAAAEAHLWLADRAQSRGAFAQSLAHYREALRSVAPSERGHAVAGAQLAAAMMGQTLVDEPVGPADFGEVRLAPAEFSKLLGEMRGRRAVGNASSPATPQPAPADLPTATTLETQVRGRLDGDVGSESDKIPGEILQQPLDWVARQTAVVADGARLIFSNRFQVSAFDPQTAKFTWRTMLGGESAATHTWSLTPMRPLVTASRVFVRRLPKTGPELAALDAATGRVFWSTGKDANKFVVSDPFLVQEELFALTATWADQEVLLALTCYDIQSGSVSHEHPLVRLRESWWQQQQRSCQAAPLGDTVVVACGGCVLRADLTGDVRWLRRETWVPPPVDHGWVVQEPSPPIESGGRIFVMQPGVYALSAIAAETGRLDWRQPIPNLRRLLGIDGPRVLVQTGAGFAALDAASGNLLWEAAVPDPLDAVLPAGKGGLVYARRQALHEETNKPSCPLLVWIDTETGRETAAWRLDNLRDERPQLGPLVASGDRLWVLFGRGEKDPHRDIVELAPTGPSDERQAASTRARAALLPESASDRRWLPPVDPELVDAVAPVLSRWRLLSGNRGQLQPAPHREWHGEENVLEVTTSGTPLRLARRVRLPAGTPALLRLRVACDAKWRLHVEAAGKVLFDDLVQPEPADNPWKTLDISLAPVAGQTVWLVFHQAEEPGTQAHVRWKSANVVEK